MDTLAPRAQSDLADDEDESQWEQETWRQVRSLRCVLRASAQRWICTRCQSQILLETLSSLHHHCSGHPQDVYDISWSPTSEFLISGSLDHTAIVWDLSGSARTFVLSSALHATFKNVHLSSHSPTILSLGDCPLRSQTIAVAESAHSLCAGRVVGSV